MQMWQKTCCPPRKASATGAYTVILQRGSAGHRHPHLLSGLQSHCGRHGFEMGHVHHFAGKRHHRVPHSGQRPRGREVRHSFHNLLAQRLRLQRRQRGSHSARRGGRGLVRYPVLDWRQRAEHRAGPAVPGLGRVASWQMGVLRRVPCAEHLHPHQGHGHDTENGALVCAAADYLACGAAGVGAHLCRRMGPADPSAEHLCLYHGIPDVLHYRPELQHQLLGLDAAYRHRPDKGGQRPEIPDGGPVHRRAHWHRGPGACGLCLSQAALW